MDRDTMLKRLKAGYEPIDVAIEKWIDIRDTNDWTRCGASTCALCETYDKNNCNDCPLKIYGKGCAMFNSQYAEAIDQQNAQIMIDELIRVKKLMKEEKCKEHVHEEPIDMLRKREEEKTYHIGQRFRYKNARGSPNEIYILASVSNLRCELINLYNGNRWNDGVYVRDVHNIKKYELLAIIGTWGNYTLDSFELVEDKDAK